MSQEHYQYPAGTYQQYQQNPDGQHLYYDNAYYYQQPSQWKSWFDYQNPSYLKGLVVGAGVALVLSNPAVQKAMVSGAVKIWGGLQGGVEEIKERVKDIKAEVSSSE